MATNKMTEQQILQAVYTAIEADTTDWGTSDDEYLAGRRFCNEGINKWETAIIETTGSQMPVRWRELWTKLSDASDGTKTITAGTTSYATPTNFVLPSSYVRTVSSSGVSSFYEVYPPEKVSMLSNSYGYWCYFVGNQKDGFTLNFNPRLTNLKTGDTINYEYYKSATTFTTTTSKTEMADDYFLVHHVLAQFYKDEDLDLYKVHRDISNAKLDQMISNNQLGYWNVESTVDETLSGTSQDGFGY